MQTTKQEWKPWRRGGGGIPRNGEIGHMTHEIGKEGVVGQSDRQETKEEEENQQNQL